MGKTKTKKFRGSARHGRGRKAGRGKGLRGGKGNAGLHKHKYATTVKWQQEGYFHFGRVGIKPVEVQGVADTVVNVGDLDSRWPGQTTLDLGKAGITKLLGAGEIKRAVNVTVEAASGSAVKKVQAAGGKVSTSRVKRVKTPKAPAPKPGQAPAAKPAAAPPAKQAPAPKPAQGKPPAPPKA